ncbi:hypothetical protein T10_12067 [Trichinella papuae]|uniref:Uncharacterized protein n=1 Tax=Trichinella papuae TaxID=268474 RepID=A0A0V1M600_9BILA|nr:hypothetical protein T10_12067 [Trichinella papuae]
MTICFYERVSRLLSVRFTHNIGTSHRHHWSAICIVIAAQCSKVGFYDKFYCQFNDRNYFMAIVEGHFKKKHSEPYYSKERLQMGILMDNVIQFELLFESQNFTLHIECEQLSLGFFSHFVTLGLDLYFEAYSQLSSLSMTQKRILISFSFQIDIS